MIVGTFPYITAATAVVLAVFQMLLLFYVANGRGKYKTGLGDGGQPGLIRRVRIHGNLAENAPIFLILLALVEASGKWVGLVPPIAAAFLLFRLSHAIGLLIGDGPNVFRFVGVMGSVFSILGLAALMAMTLSSDTHWLPAMLR